MCFIDASKAFDRVNHEKLFLKLLNRGVPKFLIRILVYWYGQQSMFVKWGNIMSDPFKVGNGVRQGICYPLIRLYGWFVQDSKQLCCGFPQIQHKIDFKKIGSRVWSGVI